MNNPKNVWKEKKYTFPSDQNLSDLYEYCQKKKGYVYVISANTNPEWGFKVGRTKKNPFNRAKQFESEGVLITYSVINAFYFANASWAEAEAHKKLAKFNRDKEWFSCSSLFIYRVLNELYEKEQALLSKHFDTSLLMKYNVKDLFMSSGWYPESFLS